MKRNEFIRKSILSSVTALAVPSILKADNKVDKTTTKDRLIDKVGYNHIPTKENKTMNTVLHKEETRGKVDHGWLVANHSFSFANYHNPERMHFGVLRVLNDDKIAPSRGFGTHPHDNMEIISILLEGDLEHKDNMGNSTIIKNGDIQVMSAGMGITHSEYNANEDKDVKLLQIWLFPNKKNVSPRYDQISINDIVKKNKFNQILSPNKNDQGVWVYQNAWFNIGEFDNQNKLTYTLNDNTNGVYAFILEGKANIEGQELSPRDGFGIWDTDKIEIVAEKDTRILLMEVPMEVS